MLAFSARPGRAESFAGPPPSGAAPYRADIDGLRALAVLAVVFFHAEVPGFAGGYVGVDVFFVISGYLITQLLSAPERSGPARRLAEFYARRARRILPALLLMCAVSALIGWLLLLPGELVYLGKYLAGAAVFAGNIIEWHGGYFAQAFAHPLRHLWSIAVEEQFYLLYPLLLLLLTRLLPRRRTQALLWLALSSLLLCIWASRTHPAVNYFAAPTRAWELLLGALLQTAAVGPLRRRSANELLAVSALAALATCVHLYAPGTVPYPGVCTLIPCAATAALIASGGGRASYVARLLAWRPLVFVGLISYSLYLWHWPLLLFVGYYHVTPLGAGLRAAVLLAAAVLAALSWRFVEQPVRRRRVLASTRGLTIAATLGSAVIGIAGVLLWASDGFPQRFAPAVRALLEPPYDATAVRCMHQSFAELRAGAWCAFGDPTPEARRVLVWGDSHTLALLPAYEELARDKHVRLYFAARNSCLPLLGVTNSEVDQLTNRECAAFNDAVIHGLAVVNPTTLVLAARWQNAQVTPATDPALPVSASAFALALRQTVAAVSDSGTRQVCVVFDVPTLKYGGLHALILARRRQIADDFVAVAAPEAHAVLAPVEADVRTLAATGLVSVADPKDVLCAGDTCLYKHDGRSLYYDRDHLSKSGALFVRSALESCFVSPRH